MAHPADAAYRVFDETDTDDESAHSADVLRRVHVFIRDRVIQRHKGKLPNARTIAVRLIVLQALLEPDEKRSLRTYARELGCSRAWLSKVAIHFCDTIGMRASWQRIDSRETFRDRAKGVHDGTWVASSENGKWARRKLREAKREGKGATPAAVIECKSVISRH